MKQPGIAWKTLLQRLPGNHNRAGVIAPKSSSSSRRWMEGSIALELGRIETAEAAFREVQRAFLEQRMGYDAALVSLDLAMLYVQEGRTGELKRLAEELVPVFEAWDIHREGARRSSSFSSSRARKSG